MGRLAAPSVDPFHCFPGQRPAERVVIFARHHWFFDIGIFIRFSILLLIPVGIIVGIALADVTLSSAVRTVLLVVFSWYTLVLMLSFYVTWLKRYLDYIVISTERIIDVNQIGIFEQQVSETSLSEIQDVSCHIPGFWAELVGYGNLTIQTAAENSLFQMHHIPKPMEVRSKILGVRDRHMEKLQAGAFEEAMHVRDGDGKTAQVLPNEPPKP